MHVDREHVAEGGSQYELIRRDGLYARLYEEQFGAGAVQAFCSDGLAAVSGDDCVSTGRGAHRAAHRAVARLIASRLRPRATSAAG